MPLSSGLPRLLREPRHRWTTHADCTSFHRRSNAQGLVNPCEVIVHVKQRNHGDVVVQLLTEGVRQASEPAHVHPHIKILPLHITGADVFVVRRTDDVYALGAQTLRRAVALLPFGIVAVPSPVARSL